MRLGRSLMIGALPLASIAGSAVAQPTGNPALVPLPADEAFAALAPDDAAERLIQFCSDLALGVAPELHWAVQRRFQRIFPGHPPGPGRGRDGRLNGPFYIDVTTQGRLFMRVAPNGPCLVTPDGGVLGEPMRAAFERQLAKSNSFAPLRGGDTWVWARPGQDLYAHVGSMLMRIGPWGPATDP